MCIYIYIWHIYIYIYYGIYIYVCIYTHIHTCVVSLVFVVSSDDGIRFPETFLLGGGGGSEQYSEWSRWEGAERHGATQVTSESDVLKSLNSTPWVVRQLRVVLFWGAQVTLFNPMQCPKPSTLKTLNP